MAWPKETEALEMKERQNEAREKTEQDRERCFAKCRKTIALFPKKCERNVRTFAQSEYRACVSEIFHLFFVDRCPLIYSILLSFFCLDRATPWIATSGSLGSTRDWFSQDRRTWRSQSLCLGKYGERTIILMKNIILLMLHQTFF